MKIKILVSCSGADFSFIPGQEPDVDDKIGKDLIRAKFAEEIKPDKPPKPSKPPKPTDGNKSPEGGDGNGNNGNADPDGSERVPPAGQ